MPGKTTVTYDAETYARISDLVKQIELCVSGALSHKAIGHNVAESIFTRLRQLEANLKEGVINESNVDPS